MNEKQLEKVARLYDVIEEVLNDPAIPISAIDVKHECRERDFVPRELPTKTLHAVKKLTPGKKAEDRACLKAKIGDYVYNMYKDNKYMTTISDLASACKKSKETMESVNIDEPRDFSAVIGEVEYSYSVSSGWLWIQAEGKGVQLSEEEQELLGGFFSEIGVNP